jgi:hypothetical protein
VTADPKKAARAALYVARKTFAGGGDVTDNPNFQTWFGDSALHDNGVPRTYYTGTSKDKDFTSFNVGRHGAWFTTDPQEASMYAMENDSQGHVWEGGGYKRTNTASRVIPAYLKSSNPYTGDRPQHISNSQNYKKAQSDWFDQLRAAGHDAWVPSSMNGSLAVMLKHPTQIKSAIGNNCNFDSKSPHIAKATGGATDNDASTSKHTPHNPAVAELKHLLTMHRDELRSMKGRTQYAAIDGIMKRISHKHGIAPSKLHDDWMSVYHQTPDAWVEGDHGSVVDRALKMTNRGGYAFGGSPAGLASATGAPINFAPAAGAFTGLPSPETLNLAPSKATLAAILASRPTTYTGSSKPLESKYIGPSIAAPTFNASAYNLPDNPLEEGQNGSGDRWHPDASGGGGAGGIGGGSARGGRIHRADGGEAGYKETPFQHIEKRSPGWGASWTPLHEVSQKLGGIKKISESASNYGDFMNVMAHKAKNDQLSPRDLIKSYLMTVSSQGRQAVNPQTILKNWPDYPGPIHDKIRPEGAMGEWLLSPIGKRYLDAAEQGIVDHGAISHALKSFGGFGKINNAEGKALPWAAQSLVPHTKIVSNMIAASLEGRHSAEDWRNWVKNNIHGVGFAKSGFWGSMLGRGDQSVPDARQLVLHTPNKNDEATSLIGVGGGVPASQREGEAMKRIIDRQNALGLSIPKELSPHYQALAHHTIWDAAGGTDTTHQDVINAMKHAASGGAIDGDNEHPVAMIFKALGMPGLERGDKQTTHQDVINAMRHAATGGAIEDPAHSHPLAQAMAEIGLPMGDSRIHRADGGETDNQLPEPATASMPSKRQAPFGVTPPQGAVPSPMSQATRNLTDPGQVTIKSMSDAFNRAISNHLSLSPGEKITNARQAAQNISEFLGSSKTGKMNALLTANGKLMKAAKSQSGKEPVTISDGRGVETLGLSLFPDFKEGQFRVCGNSDSCRDSCIGKKSNAYSMDPTQAADQIPLTRQDREGMSGKPRMSALARTHALMRDPESFAVYLHDLIDHEKIAAARRGNLLGVRLNTLSDIPPSVFAPIIKAHPDVAFYDYTKMNYDPIAPNHHYTYSSTGVSQPEIGVENPFQNWHKSRDRLDQGENVAMAFSHKSGEAFPRMIHDEETGRHYKVVSGDEHDFRPLDIQDEGKAGVIVALKNIAKNLGHETAAQKSNGFFVKHDPGFAKDKKGNFVKDENGDRIPQNLIYTIRAQQKKRNPLTVFKRSGQDV